jgi:hypothetical protein
MKRRLDAIGEGVLWETREGWDSIEERVRSVYWDCIIYVKMGRHKSSWCWEAIDDATLPA